MHQNAAVARRCRRDATQFYADFVETSAESFVATIIRIDYELGLPHTGSLAQGPILFGRLWAKLIGD